MTRSRQVGVLIAGVLLALVTFLWTGVAQAHDAPHGGGGFAVHEASDGQGSAAPGDADRCHRGGPGIACQAATALPSVGLQPLRHCDAFLAIPPALLAARGGLTHAPPNPPPIR